MSWIMLSCTNWNTSISRNNSLNNLKKRIHRKTFNCPCGLVSYLWTLKNAIEDFLNRLYIVLFPHENTSFCDLQKWKLTNSKKTRVFRKQEVQFEVFCPSENRNVYLGDSNRFKSKICYFDNGFFFFETWNCIPHFNGYTVSAVSKRWYYFSWGASSRFFLSILFCIKDNVCMIHLLHDNLCVGTSPPSCYKMH